MLLFVAGNIQHSHRRLTTVIWKALCLTLLSQIIITAASPVGTNPTAGPLGISPGSSQGTIPAGGSGNGTFESGNTFGPGIKSLDTVLAVFSALLTTITYATLIGPGTRLSSTSKLPLASIETNIGNLLSKSWPDTSYSIDVGGTKDKNDNPDAIRLVYVGKMDNEKSRAARGTEQCESIPEKNIATPPMWLTTGSSLTKSIVQLAVWEWISIWMALTMVISTLAFNGFFTNQIGPDSYPRLVVVLMYFASFCGHSWYVWKTCRNFFTLLGAGASWSLLNKAAFASVDLNEFDARLAGGPAPVFRQVGKPSGSPTFPAYEASLLQDVGLSQNGTGMINPESLDEEKGAVATVSSWQQREVSSSVESGDTALERIVTNVMTMLGITITTGFSVWTSIQSSDTSQLGSLALLASLTLGAGTMFSSAVELSVMDTSFKNLLFLKEIMINGQALAHVQKRALKKRVIGFTHNTVAMKAVRMRDLVRFTSFWKLLFFGPAHALLPSEADHSRQSEGAMYELHVEVRDKPMILTTESTNRHSKRLDGANIEAINVCYTPDITSDHSAQKTTCRAQAQNISDN